MDRHVSSNAYEDSVRAGRASTGPLASLLAGQAVAPFSRSPADRGGLSNAHYSGRSLTTALVLMASLFCSFAPSVVAQEEARVASDVVRQTSRPLRMRKYKPGVWATHQVQLSNNGDRPVQVVTGGSFEGAPLRLYGRRVVLPPHSRRIVSFPVLPTATPDGRIEWHGQVYTVNDSGKQLIRAADSYMIDAERFPAANERVCVVIADVETIDECRVEEVNQLAAAMRMSLRLSPAVSRLTADDLPAQLSALSVADHVILASNRIADSAVKIDGLRQWVEQGGSLWIMLDLVDPATVERLFADSIRVTTVGRTSLTQFQLWNRVLNKSSGDPVAFDYPVDLVRIIADELETIHEVGGWPVSSTAHLGKGRVVLSALGAKGWYGTDPVSPSRALDEVLDLWFRPHGSSPLEVDDFEPMLLEQTGYRVPERRTVLTLLFGFCALLGVSGFLLQRPRRSEAAGTDSERSSRRLARLAVVGPVLALLTTGSLLWLGIKSRADAPATVAIGEFVEVSPGGLGAFTQGTAVVSVPDPVTADVGMSGSQLLIPTHDRLEGTVRQLIWTGPRDAIWEDYELRPGLQFFETSRSDQLTEPARAWITLGPEGLKGEFELSEFTGPEDLVLATAANHAMTLSIDEPGRFHAGPADVVAPGDYIDATLLSDVQSQRNTVYRRLLNSNSDYHYPSRPMLFAWVQPSSSDVVFPESLSVQRQSLLAVPVEFRRTPPDTEVVIPAPLLPFTAMVDQVDASSAWNARARRWVPRLSGGRTLLRFDLPDAVRPFQISGGRLQLEIAAPERSVLLSVGNATERREIASLDGPAGSFEYAWKAADIPELDAGQGVFVEVFVSELQALLSNDIAEDRNWAMDYLQLQLTGRTAPLDEVEESD